MEYPTLVERAARIAATAHKEQVRKESNTPYIVHLCMVARILTVHKFSDVVVAAGFVHDVLEDTDVTLEELRSKLGDEVADIVSAVTNDDSLPWEDKKRAYIESVRNSSDEVKAVATADKIHNAESLLAAHAVQGETLWTHFNTGKEKKIWFEVEMLKMLQETWNHSMLEEYAEMVKKIQNLV